jgi:N-acetylmuramic acid 6-phosphate (MurNAc-6-P) etherase
MVDMQLSNSKLVDRGKMIMDEILLPMSKQQQIPTVVCAMILSKIE